MNAQDNSITIERPANCRDEGMAGDLSGRFWEVDFLRGCAILLMVLYHLAFDLNYFAVYDIDVSSGFPLAVASTAASLFLLLVGISLTLSYSRAKLLGMGNRFFHHLLNRSAWILGLALGITLVTYLAIGRGFIVFGVLHLIGLSLLLAYPFLRLQKVNFVIGLLFILIGTYLETIHVGFPWLLWLGLAPTGFYSVDYVPVFPWFGVILMGMGLGSVLYQGYRRAFFLPELSAFPAAGVLAFLGRNSLAIYLIHQPAIITILYLSGVSLLLHQN